MEVGQGSYLIWCGLLIVSILQSEHQGGICLLVNQTMMQNSVDTPSVELF